MLAFRKLRYVWFWIVCWIFLLSWEHIWNWCHQKPILELEPYFQGIACQSFEWASEICSQIFLTAVATRHMRVRGKMFWSCHGPRVSQQWSALDRAWATKMSGWEVKKWSCLFWTCWSVNSEFYLTLRYEIMWEKSPALICALEVFQFLDQKPTRFWNSYLELKW